MNDDSSIFRNAVPADRESILEVHRQAFGTEEGPVIAQLVGEMLDDPSAQPMLSLVSESAGKLTGHVLFTNVTLQPEPLANCRILAPLAVIPEVQGQGIGEQLTREALRGLQKEQVELVFVLGYPDYYHRFGFQAAGRQQLSAPYPIAAENADAWMVLELKPGAVDAHVGTVRCCQTLNRPEFWVE